MLSLGALPSALDAYRYKVAGAPGDRADDLTGYVQVTRADTITGLIDPVDSQTLAPDSALSSSTTHFGWSVLATDIRDCVLISGPNPRTEFCGQELLVGAPNLSSASDPGKVFWYRSDLLSSDIDHQNALKFVGLVPAPTGLYPDANFGAALAAPAPLLDKSEPWRASGVSPGWVAIGAPSPGIGQGEIYIYAVNPANSSPLTLRQTLYAPRSDSGFGEVLTVGDFNGDGAPDLAAGGPNSVPLNQNGNGTHVWIYVGDPSYDALDPYSMPLAVSALEITPGATSSVSLPRDAQEFGAALAAGPFWGDYDDRDQLLIGVPGLNNGEGAVCQVVINSAGTAEEDQLCHVNPHSTFTVTEFSRWGSSVAVGNFYSADADGAFDSPAALHPEVAVGRPMYGTEAGRLDVFLTDEFGIDPDSFVVYFEDSAGSEPYAHFGETVASGYVQESQWQDLVIGSPNRGADVGAVTLTKAEPLSSRALDGVWLMNDVNGNQRQITTRPATGASSQTWTGVNAEAVVRAVITGMGMDPDSPLLAPLLPGLQMDVTIQYTAGTPSTGSITMTPTNWPIGFINAFTGMNSSCNVAPSGAMLMEQISVFACE